MLKTAKYTVHGVNRELCIGISAHATTLAFISKHHHIYVPSESAVIVKATALLLLKSDEISEEIRQLTALSR